MVEVEGYFDVAQVLDELVFELRLVVDVPVLQVQLFCVRESDWDLRGVYLERPQTHAWGLRR